MTPNNYVAKLVMDRGTEIDPHEWLPALDRRAIVRMLGLTAAGTLVGCGGLSNKSSSGTTASTTALSASTTSAGTGASVTLTASVTPTAATGNVTFYNGSTSIGTAALSSGTATLSTTFNTAGTEALKGVYAGDATYAGSTSTAVTVTVGGASACTQTLEGEEGPYFVDDSASGYNRSSIVTNLDGSDTQDGVAFTLTLFVFDAKNGCTAMQGVQADIWHCNASGVYSAEASESTSSESWLRGYQISDTSGMVKFTTIIPGWYQGRTTHIHLRLRSSYDTSSTGGTNTMQLFFDQTLVDTLDTTVSPYSAEGKNPTTNASDRVYSQEEDGTTLMTLTGSTNAGYTATANIYLPIA